MNATEAVTKIKLLLGLENEVTTEETVIVNTEATTEEAVEFASAELVDGTKVKVEGEFEVGKSCYVEAEDEDIMAPAGIHQTADDKLITIDENGVITAIEEMEVEKEEEVQAEDVEEVAMEDSKEEEAMEEEVKEDVVMEIVTALKPFIDNLDELKEKVNAMESKFESFASAPAAKPIKKVREDFESTRLNRIAKIAQIKNNNK